MSTDLMAVDVLSDEHMLKILHLTSESPISLVDLSTSCGITGAACFRRVSDLKRMGLLKEKSVPAGSPERIYTSNVKKIEIQFRDGLLYGEVEWKKGTKEIDCFDPLSGIHQQSNIIASGKRERLVYDPFRSDQIWNRSR